MTLVTLTLPGGSWLYYGGIQQSHTGTHLVFTDPVTGGTFMLPAGQCAPEVIEARLLKLRSAYATPVQYSMEQVAALCQTTVR